MRAHMMPVGHAASLRAVNLPPSKGYENDALLACKELKEEKGYLPARPWFGV